MTAPAPAEGSDGGADATPTHAARPAPSTRESRRVRIGREIARLGYRRIVLSLVYLGIVPAVLLSAIGVLLLVVGEARFNLLMGILVLTFTGTLVTGVILVMVFVRRERNLAELQSDFVSKVSHELRTPLTSIRMFTETLILRRGDRAAEDRCIGALDRESARLQQLIDRLLNWGRMESGRRTYLIEPHPPALLVADAIEAFESMREQRSAHIETSIPEGLPLVACDRAALADALVNLLSNATKYGGDPPQIRVTAEAKERAVCIAVSDDGPGIPKREHRRIFEKFYRVDDLLAREREGSGLGLAIVQHVLKAHGGRVTVDSDVGRGSTFTLWLPLDVHGPTEQPHPSGA